MDCIFCKIVAGEIPCKKAYEDDQVLAFYDIAPAAPVHIVVIPKAHSHKSAREVSDADGALVAHLFAVIAKLANELNLENGYRVVTNIGADAGQTVHHMHFHLLGGGALGAMA